jgi:hypothetical protein
MNFFGRIVCINFCKNHLLFMRYSFILLKIPKKMGFVIFVMSQPYGRIKPQQNDLKIAKNQTI